MNFLHLIECYTNYIFLNFKTYDTREKYTFVVWISDGDKQQMHEHTKLIVAGDPAVGKSALQSYFCQTHSPSGIYGVRYTVDDRIFFNVAHLRFAEIRLKIHIWYLPEFDDLTSQEYYESADGVLLVYDISNRKSFENLGNWKTELLKLYTTIPCVLLGNKKDEQEFNRAISKAEGRELAGKWKIPFFEASSKTGLNVNECFYRLLHTIIAYHRIQSILNEMEISSSLLKPELCRLAVQALKMDGFLGGEQIPHIEESLERILCKQTMESLIHSMLNDERVYVRSTSANALSIIGIRDKRIIKSLIHTLLNDEHWHVRLSAADASGKIRDRESVNSLTQSLIDPHEHVRKISAEALGNIGDKYAIPFLIQTLQDKKKEVRRQAFESLIKLDYRIPEEKQLFLFLEDEKNFDQILNLVRKNFQMLEDIFLALKNSDVDTNAAKVLGRIGLEIPELLDQILPHLYEALKSGKREIQKKAVWSLGKIIEKEPRGAKRIVSHLIPLLKDERWDVRCETVKAIGEIGDKSPEIVENAIPSLIELLIDDDPRAISIEKEEVQINIVKALVKWQKAQNKFLISKGKIDEVLSALINNIKSIGYCVQPANVKSIGRYYIPNLTKEISDFFHTILPEDLSRGLQFKLKRVSTANFGTLAAVKVGLEEIVKALSILGKIILI